MYELKEKLVSQKILINNHINNLLNLYRLRNNNQVTEAEIILEFIKINCDYVEEIFLEYNNKNWLIKEISLVQIKLKKELLEHSTNISNLQTINIELEINIKEININKKSGLEELKINSEINKNIVENKQKEVSIRKDNYEADIKGLEFFKQIFEFVLAKGVSLGCLGLGFFDPSILISLNMDPATVISIGVTSLLGSEIIKKLVGEGK